MQELFGNKRRDGGRVFALAVSLVTLVFACLPLFSVNCIQGHDIDYHLLRIEALKTGILNGAPFLRVNMLFFGGEGYASSMFYPDFLLYIPSVLRSMGAGIGLSYHIFVAFCVIAAFVSMYFCALYISENTTAALISAVCYTLCQYHMDDIYTRAAVGEFTAFIFIPFVAAGLYDLTEKDFKKPWLIMAGMAGTLLCHTLTTVFCILFCIGYLIVRARVFMKKPELLLKLFLAALVTAALTCFYWLPVMEQMSLMEFKYAESIFDVDYEKLLLREIFENSAGRMGIALIILLFPAFLIKHGEDEKVRTADIFALAGIVFTLFTTGLFPWKRLSGLVSAVQFPWRLFIMSCLLFSLAAGIYIAKAAEKKELAVILVLSVMTVSAVANLNRTEEGYYSYSDDYYNEVKFTKSVIGGEWLPKAVSDRNKLGNDRDTAFDAEGRDHEALRQGNAVTVSSLNSAYVDVPLIFYPGYSAEDGQGRTLKVDGSGKNGCVRVYTGGSDSVRVYYGGTVLQKAADIISLLSLLLVMAVVVFKGKKSGEKAGKE